MRLILCTMTALCFCVARGSASAQVTGVPDAPGVSVADAASLFGTVTDENGRMIPGAHIQITAGDQVIDEVADEDGEFHAYGLFPGTYTVRVVADGFLNGNDSGVLQPDEQKELPPVQLRIKPNASQVTVFATVHDIATAQLREEETQRVLGVVPNFYVVYYPNPAPLSTRQKFHLAWRSTIDPVTLAASGFAAGVEQATDSFSGYGQGAAGFGKRFGASLADGSISTFLGGAVLPTLFHQDPRYWYQGTGTKMSRARHAIASVVVTRGDDGRREFNYSSVIGNFASAGLSNLYYPASDRNGAGLTLANAALGTAFGAFAGLMQEFVVPKLTPHRPGSSKAKD